MAKKTEWYPATIKPVRVGWYEYRGCGLGNHPDRRYWTGCGWKYEWEVGGRSALDGDEWRGLAQPPKGAK